MGSRASVSSSEKPKKARERPERFNRPLSRKGRRLHLRSRGSREYGGNREPETPRPRGEHCGGRRRKRVSTDFALWRETESPLLSRVGCKDISQGFWIQGRALWLQRAWRWNGEGSGLAGSLKDDEGSKGTGLGKLVPSTLCASPASSAKTRPPEPAAQHRGIPPSLHKARDDRALKDSKLSHLSLCLQIN